MKNKEIIEKVLKDTKKKWDSMEDGVWSVDKAIKYSIEKTLSLKEENFNEFIKKLKEKISFLMNNSDYTEDDLIQEIDKLAKEFKEKLK